MVQQQPPIKMTYLATQKQMMSPMVRNYWGNLDVANDAGQPVVFCLGGAPQEIFRTMDFAVFFGENFSAGCAVARVSQDLCQMAEGQGYPIELCSYIRTHIGAMSTGKNPMGKLLPKPDMAAYVTSRCTAYPGWGKLIKEEFPKVPVYNIDIPPNRDDMGKEEYDEIIKYLVRQMKDMVAQIETHSGKKFDYDRFAEMIGNTGKGARSFVKLQDMLATKPAPLSLIDIFFNLFPMVCLKGLPEIEQYYDAVQIEVKQRIADGFSAVPNEKHRIYWDGIAIWTRLANQYQQTAKHGAALVAAAYAYNMAHSCVEYDAAHPFESIAHGFMKGGYNNLGLKAKVDYVVDMVERFKCDAMIMQVSRSCKPFFMTEYSVTKEVSRRTGVPFCEVEGDMADPRLYSEKEIEDRIDSFLQLMNK